MNWSFYDERVPHNVIQASNICSFRIKLLYYSILNSDLEFFQKFKNCIFYFVKMDRKIKMRDNFSRITVITKR